MVTNIPVHIVLALNEIGQAEIPGPQSNERISEYLETVGMPSSDEIPWCSAFPNWILKQRNIQGTNDAAAISWEAWGRACDLRIGSVVILKRGAEAWMRHVGFLLDSSAAMIRLLGGNQLNRVGINAYSKSRITAIRWSDDFEFVKL